MLEEEVNETILALDIDGLVEKHLKSELQSCVASLHRKPSSETDRGGVKRKAAPTQLLQNTLVWK